MIKNIPCSYFNGSYIYYTGLSLQNNQSYSISIWVNNQKYPVTDGEEGFCSLSSSSIRKRITFSSRVDSTKFYADAIGISGEGYIISDELLNLGDWYHLVGIVDVLSKEVIFYKNGKLIEQGTYEHWNNGYNYSGTSGFIIGNLCSWVGYEGMYRATAYISSVRIYNRVINKTEVLALFKEF